MVSHLHQYSCIETLLHLAFQTWPSPASFASLASPHSLSACTINPLLGLSPSLTLLPSPNLSYQTLIWYLYLYILICIFNLKWSLLLAHLLLLAPWSFRTSLNYFFFFISLTLWQFVITAIEYKFTNDSQYCCNSFYFFHCQSYDYNYIWKLIVLYCLQYLNIS